MSLESLQHVATIRILAMLPNFTPEQKQVFRSWPRGPTTCAKEGPMTRPLSTALAIACLLGTSLGAQRPVSLALGGGVSYRTSGFGEHVDNGWHALAALAVS